MMHKPKFQHESQLPTVQQILLNLKQAPNLYLAIIVGWAAPSTA